MEEIDMREAYYHWVVSDVCDMIRLYGYTKVLMDIDKSLKTDDLEVEILNAIEDGSDGQERSDVE